MWRVVTLEESRAENMQLRAEIASLQNRLADMQRWAAYTEGLYMEMKARVIEMENDTHA